MTIRTYASPEAFKVALEARIRTAASVASRHMTRFRQSLVFDRFLARAFVELGDRLVVKGGIVLELRLERARSTKDIDLRLTGAAEHLLTELQRAGQRDLGDFMTYLVVPDAEHPTLEGDGMVYDGLRFRVECRLAGKLYGMPFGVDAGFGDVLTAPPEQLHGSPFLDFVGAQAATFRIYPRVAHIAEKLHAYTLPRTRANSRVKDLPDLALLATTGPFDAAELRDALDTTFRFRATHDLPPGLPTPPLAWAPTYVRMATDDNLPWRSLEDLHVATRAFLDPVLAAPSGRWEPGAWAWIP